MRMHNPPHPGELVREECLVPLGLSVTAGWEGATTVAWYDSSTPLRSGWAWGQKNLENAAAVVEVPVEKGKLFLFGPEILFRSQPHGTYKLFFNAIFYGAASAGQPRQ